jgi:hypothetical protein
MVVIVMSTGSEWRSIVTDDVQVFEVAKRNPHVRHIIFDNNNVMDYRHKSPFATIIKKEEVNDDITNSDQCHFEHLQILPVI